MPLPDPQSAAQVLHPKTTQPPTVTDGNGEYDIFTLLLFERKCRTYFTAKDIDDDDQVRRVMYSFEEEAITTWIEDHQAEFVHGTFDNFMEELRAHLLKPDWAVRLSAQQFATHQLPNESAATFASSFLRMNAALRNTEYAIVGDQALINFVHGHLTPALQIMLQEENVRNDGGDFSVWMRDVSMVDNKLRERNATLASMVKVAVTQAVADDRRIRREARASRPSPQASSSSTSQHRYNRASTPGASSSGTVRCPPLTEAERQVLRDHRGCFKCRRLNVNHMRSNCPNPYPSGVNYHPVTAPVAAVSANVVAAVIDDSDYDSESTTCVPSPYHHLQPLLSISASPSSSSIQVRPLMDTGSKDSLISLDLVKELDLKTRSLGTPRPSGSAFGGGKLDGPVFTEYVKIHLVSQDQAWSSGCIKALVSPNLCTKLIIGERTMAREHLELHPASKDIIHSPSGVNLMKPKPNRPRPVVTQRREAEEARRPRPIPTPAQLNLEFHGCLTPKSVPPKTDVFTAGEIVAAIRSRVEILGFEAKLKKLDQEAKERYSERFPRDIPHVHKLPTDVLYRISLKDAHKTIATRNYQSPRKYKEAWRILIDEHLAAGRIQRSSSPHASPSFLVPKKDPNALPRWVMDYRQMNANTVKDAFPLPLIKDILADCAGAKFYAKIDMTNSFHQTRVDPSSVPYTAVSTPLGLFEWLVMPMGGSNAPSTHQRRMMSALHHLIGRICHVYLDDIIIWSNSLEEHTQNIALVMKALEDAHLFCSLKKTTLYASEVLFLGHIISEAGLRPDPAKVDKIRDWPRPRTTTDVRAFLGIVRYLDKFLPKLVDHTMVLTPLTRKEFNGHGKFPEWTSEHQAAFDGIKNLVLSSDCLTNIDPNSDNLVFVTTDASDTRTGAVLSTGPTWEESRPVEFDSEPLNPAERNYPTHEKEMLAIIRALEKWSYHLLGTKCIVYTDHSTLQFFETQKNLSRRQQRWLDRLSLFDYEIRYLPGEKNSAADALSRYPEHSDLHHITACVYGLALAPHDFDPLYDDLSSVSAATFTIASDARILKEIKRGYRRDPYCKMLKANPNGTPGVRYDDESKLLYMGSRLIIPRHGDLREQLYRLAHDTLGHFGMDKSYAVLSDSYFWPNMRRDLEKSYIPSCADCQRNKSRTTKPPGPLHPLPVPDSRFDSVAIDFIGPLVEDQGFNGIVTMTDRLGQADVQIRPIRMDMTAEGFAKIFFDHWYCENGLPLNIISDRDKLFISKFWSELHRLTGVKLNMSTSYHPESDGASERTNKTVNQLLRYEVDRNQKGWVNALPHIRFAIMNTENASTGVTPFQLKSGHSPRLLPPLTVHESEPDETETELVSAIQIIDNIQRNVKSAQDNLTVAKTQQAHHANKHRGPEDVYQVGDMVMLSTQNRRREYANKHEKRSAKFFPRFDGPYRVVKSFPEKSEYTLKLPGSTKIFPGFHASLLQRHVPNDADLFPNREHARPGPVITEDGQEEWEVECIVDERKRGRGRQYLVRWAGWDASADEWIAGADMEETEALDKWKARSQTQEG